MKILQLCGKDFFGAGRAAYRLHMGLRDAGIDCQMWVGAKRTNDASVLDVYPGRLNKKWTKVFVKLEKLKIKFFAGGAMHMFSLGAPAHSLRKKIEKEKPDLIHLHWTNRGFMDLNTLRGIKIPVVISLHDMWWFTGGCHYDEECGRYIDACGLCPVLKKDGEQGLSLRHLKHKKEVLNTVDKLTFVGLSTWMRDCAAKSAITQGHRVINLPNGINISQFSPRNRKVCREKLALPRDKKLILFAAVGVLSEPRKGYKYISRALEQCNPDEYELVVIGEKSNENSVSGLKTHFLGEINDDSLLIEYISATDVSVVPSLQENLSNLIMESLACATPVVAFNIGGNGDMIIHRKNGYLAKEKDVDDLAGGIKFCCDTEHNKNLSQYAQQSIKERFNIQDVSKKYVQLYKTLCGES
ncbi:Glycosyltransferase involved in cell wall bisynthesis [Saccharicrinis carchari]|uniref:Glycosyltransferase involved in cell wall bisynthesis n=1 Tax=Saccharicrinis carchari TaxID=1168039 RepID=A0A521EPA0_SACCC|nr:glycosyltransferase [Saccharicrinis carchari]SMO85745.1 Glycosyltransferase involved in cell wall bisynthesis [Saccharicrinis carchari]